MTNKSRKEVLVALLGYLEEGTFETSYHAQTEDNTLQLSGSGQMSEGPFSFTATVSDSKVHLVTYSMDPAIQSLEDILESVENTSAIGVGESKLSFLSNPDHPNSYTRCQLALWLKN